MEEISSVSQVNMYIKNMFLREYALNRISVKGEVSNCKYHSSGHIYFTVKDDESVLSISQGTLCPLKSHFPSKANILLF